MSDPSEGYVNSILPFLDPQQAAALLIWLKQNKVADVDGPLKELLEAYPYEWAFEELKWPMSGFPLSAVTKAVKDSISQNWLVVLRSTLALRGEVPDSAFDFGRTPGAILEIMESFENRLAAAGAGLAAAAKNRELMHEIGWLLHWTFWVLLRYYLPHVKGQQTQGGGSENLWSDVIDALFSDKCLQTVSILCPHLVRYYVVLILPDRKRTEHVWLIISLTSSIKFKLNDCYVRFALDIFNDTNLKNAQKELNEIVNTTNDFFLSAPALKANILKNARLLIFEHYCRIHKSLNLDVIRQLAIGQEAADEKWIVNLMKDAKIEAKIDLKNDLIQMTSPPVNPYAAIIEKSKNTFYKTNLLIKNLGC